MSLFCRRSAALAVLGLVSVAVPLGSAPSSAAPASQVPPVVPTGATIKPFAPGSITIDPDSITAGSPDIAVTVAPGSALGAPTLEVTSTGPVIVDRELQPVAADATSTVSVSVTSPTGPSTITATLSGDPASGSSASSISDTVWIDRVGSSLVVSDTGTQDLQLEVIDRREATGLVTAAQADAAREEALGGGAAVDLEVTTNAVCATVCLSGNVKWTDSAGTQQIVRKAPVQVWEDEPGTDQLVTTVTTDDNGDFTATLADNDDGPGEGGRDPYVRVLAAGPGFSIQDKYIDGSVTTDVATGTDLSANFVANNTADNNTAFSLQNAMVVAGEYVQGVRGSLFPDIVVKFPSPGGGSFYDGEFLQVDGGDRWDWDVMLHEYGHYVADQLNIEDNPGGDHSSGDNLSDARGSKAIGIPLAWGEGWPTYFAVSLLREMGTASLAIPNIGDTKYQDTEDQIITDDLESGGTLGEDNEFTVMSILWDLYDDVDDGLDHVSLGTNAIWDLLDANDPTTLSAAKALFAPDLSVGSAAANCVFSQYDVAPKITGASPVTLPTGTASPKVTWVKGNGGTHPNDRFVVEYRKADGSLLFASPAQAANSYTAPAGAWAATRASSGGAIHVTVVGTQTDAPVTGPYRSCAKELRVDTSRTADVAWIEAAYEDFLDRAPTTAELAATAVRLGAGTTRAAVAKELSTSNEYLGVIITRFYLDTLDRAPDPGGLNHWRTQIRTGRKTVAQVAAAFYSSSEYYSEIGGGTPASWIDDLYPKLLDRPADAAGRAYWVGKVASKGRGYVAAQFYGSLESRRVRVDGVYQGLLARSADNAGLEYWAGKIATQGDLALAVNLATSSEYGTKALLRFP